MKLFPIFKRKVFRRKTARPFFGAGFSILETAFAVSILIIAIGGPLALAGRSIRAASLSKNQIVAFHLAQEAMEFVRNKRDSNVFAGLDWLDGFGPCLSLEGCVIDSYAGTVSACGGACPVIRHDPASGLYNYALGDDQVFTRKTRIISITSDEIKVTSELSWLEIFSNHSFTLEEHLFKWH